MQEQPFLPVPERRRFESLDALRFFAFLRVFFLHLSINMFPLFNLYRKGGENGVSFFFTLSGFLISYLLLEERLRSGEVKLGQFMLRRVLRIWPLYFLMAGVAFATPWFLSLSGLSSSPDGYAPDWRFTFFFLENYKLMITNDHPSVAPLWVMWSLCVEEHYYILWGLIFTFVPLRRLPVVLGAMAILPIGARMVYRHYGLDQIDLPTNLDYFAFGGLTAMAYIKWNGAIEAFAAKIPKWALWLFLALTAMAVLTEYRVLQNGALSVLRPTVLSLLFCALLLVLVPKNAAIKISAKNPLTWLGTISYGLYLIHTVSNSFVKSVLMKFGFTVKDPLTAIIYIATTLTVVIALSALSYYFLEKPFLSLKKRFSRG